MQGLFKKYSIQKADGTPVDPNAQYFVLRVDTDPAAQDAVLKYAESVQLAGNDEFATQLRMWVYKLAPDRFGYPAEHFEGWEHIEGMACPMGHTRKFKHYGNGCYGCSQCGTSFYR